MKKLFLLLITTILLTGCFGNENGNSEIITSNPNYTVYKDADFSISYPKDWEIINKNTFTSNVPAETIIAFRNNLKNEVFTANTNISKIQIPKETTSEDLGKSTLLKSKESLISFKELSKDPIIIKLGETEIQTFISGFEGKKSTSDPIIKFKQLYVSMKGFGYVITGAYLPYEDESVVKMIDEMLHSFSLNGHFEIEAPWPSG
ncbi:MAG: hypothetical protein PHP74_01175 [Candidatus Gracilibacteria bacterium]|nr:hypothetical protein [Candidatus Gracilibacteria bacterium]